MFKSFLKICIVCSSFIGIVAQATLITDDLTADNYITYNNVDFAWASSVNSERWYLDLSNTNTLSAPDTHTGWTYASAEQLGMLTGLPDGELLALFTRDDGSYIHAFEYWNTFFDEVLDSENLSMGQISSHWAWSVPGDEDFDALTPAQKGTQALEITNTSSIFFDTIYVRDGSADQSNEPTPVPEPSTLFIFALGLIALAKQKKLFS